MEEMLPIDLTANTTSLVELEPVLARHVIIKKGETVSQLLIQLKRQEWKKPLGRKNSTSRVNSLT